MYEVVCFMIGAFDDVKRGRDLGVAISDEMELGSVVGIPAL